MRGTLRSTETAEAEGSGLNISEARAAALASLDLERFELQQANVVASRATGESTVRAIARSRETREHEAAGPTYDAAVRAFRSAVPDGWQILLTTVTG